MWLLQALQQDSRENQEQYVRQALDVAAGLDAYMEKMTTSPPKVRSTSLGFAVQGFTAHPAHRPPHRRQQYTWGNRYDCLSVYPLRKGLDAVFLFCCFFFVK